MLHGGQNSPAQSPYRMNSHVVLFLVLMVSTYVTSHFHSRGQEPVDDRNLMLNMMKRNMLARGRPRPASRARLTTNQVYPGMGFGNMQTRPNRDMSRMMLPFMMGGGDAFDAMEDMMPMMMMNRIPNTLGRGNKPSTRRLLQPVVIRPNIYRPTQPGVGQNDAFEMQEFMRLLPFLSMTEAGEGMADMMLPMMLLQGSGQF
uniref:Uncharacterized protein n=1 Tax=Magallana gigas TaxID=29159 RepID=A0A8W8MTH1_MAGGI